MAETTTQTQGTTEDTLLQRIERLENEKKGIIRDLQGERDKRQELEQRFAEIQTVNSAQVLPEAAQAKVDRLAQDPDSYILNVVKPLLDKEVKPVKKTVEAMATQRDYDRAYGWLAKQEKKDVEDIYGSKVEEEIARVSKEHNLNTMNPVDGVKAAYKIWKQELKDKEEREEVRQRSIQENAGERVTNPVRTGQMRFTRQEIAQMTTAEFERNRDAIMEAQAKGLIT